MCQSWNTLATSMIISKHAITGSGDVTSIEVATNGTITQSTRAKVVNKRDEGGFSMGRKRNVNTLPYFRIILRGEVTL